MNSTLKQTIIHGLEVLGVVALAIVVKDIMPTLPQTEATVIIATILGGVLKYLRANPNIKIPDYVAGTKK